MEINYFFEETQDFDLNTDLQPLIIKAFNDENKEGGELNFIFCSDDYLLKINKEYLDHDYYTDIITFDYAEQNIISGDVFISKDRVLDNAEKFNVSFENEINRVMIHGVLHLLGYKDKTENERKQMRLKEEQYMI